MRAHTAIVAGVLIACAVTAPALAAGGVVVSIDQAVPIRLSGSAAQVVIGNPSIADASVLDRRQVVLLGRSYGTTSVMVFDHAGRAIYNSLVTVVPPSSNQVAVYRGALPHHYTCASRCERTPVPGEYDSDDYQHYANPVKEYADRAKAAAAASGQQP